MTALPTPPSVPSAEQRPGNFSQGAVVSLDAADLYPLHIDAIGQITFVSMTEMDYRQSSFLDHRIHRSNDAGFTLPINEFVRVGKNLAAPPCSRYIFHISHVGSTLLSKVLGSQPDVLSLREPLLLRWLAELNNSLDKPESWVSAEQYTDYLQASLAYFSRKFHPKNEVVIKASSYTSVLAQRILDQAHAPRAIFVYTDLSSFAATILKQSYGLADIRSQAPSRLARLHRMLGIDAWKLYELSTGELVAMSWVSEMLTLELAAQSHAAQVSWIHFDNYLESDSQTQMQVFDHLQLAYDASDVEKLQSGAVMQTNSKAPGKRYNKLDRAKEIQLVLQREATEITKCRNWLHQAAVNFPAIAALTKKAIAHS